METPMLSVIWRVTDLRPTGLAVISWDEIFDTLRAGA